MDDYILSCCSTADLSASHYEERNIEIIPFHFRLDGVEYLDDGTMPIDKFYREMEEGKLIPREKIRTKRKVYDRITEIMEELADNGYKYSDKCYLSASACLDDAQQVAMLIEKRFPYIKDKILINSIGTTVGSHTGPGTVALFFWGKERGE